MDKNHGQMNTRPLTVQRVLSRLRLDASLVSTVELAEGLSVRVSDSGGAIFLAHCEGPLWVGEPGELLRPVLPGDAVLAGFGAAHIVSTCPEARDPVDVDELLRSRSLVQYSPLHVGSGEVRAKFLSALGHWSDDSAELANALLPPLAILPGVAAEDVMASLLRTMSVAIASGDRAAPAAITRIVDAMIAICVDRTMVDLPIAHDAIVLRALALIHANDERPSVAALADRLCMPRTRFHTLFAKALGRSPGDYIRDIALARAACVLREGGSLASAASRAGFSSLPSFHAAFRQKYGMTPNGYRRAAPPDPESSASKGPGFAGHGA